MRAVDAHLDLAMNALVWNRDLTLTAHETRAIESDLGLTAERSVRRDGRPARSTPGRDRPLPCHGPGPDQSCRAVEYRLPHARDRLCALPGRARVLPGAGAQGPHSDAPDRRPTWPITWQTLIGTRNRAPFGFVLLMEGADPIVEPDETEPLVERRPADGRPRPLRTERLRVRHRQRRPADREGRALLAEMDDGWG